MSPFAALITPIRPPVWRGATRAHILIGRTQGNYGKRWAPWTLIEPGVTMPTAGALAKCWALLHPRLRA